MPLKPNITFGISVTLEIKVTTPKETGSPRGLWGSYITSINLIGVKPFELLSGNGSLQTDGQCNNICPSYGGRIKTTAFIIQSHIKYARLNHTNNLAENVPWQFDVLLTSTTRVSPNKKKLHNKTFLPNLLLFKQFS